MGIPRPATTLTVPWRVYVAFLKEPAFISLETNRAGIWRGVTIEVESD